ncbi:hypothetical protein [Georgenia wangjunii]|uniref:hypothetical protein n=1 Tax=Georgenia wangjunii TaxID=3117730 RepID=UPI002F265C32
MRAVDWSVLDLSGDPVPGDPAVVRTGGERYVEVADAIGRTVTFLRRLDEGTVHVSLAVDALTERAGEVADGVERAQGRYRETGLALIDYAPQLATAQEDSLDAWTLASSARTTETEAAGQQRYYISLASDSADPDSALRYETLADNAGQDAGEARARHALAVQRVNEAIELRDRAAGDAVSRIEEITGGDGLNDGWWDNWGKDLLAVVTDIAGWVATIAGVLALAVSWIPVIGQVLGAALLLVAGVAAIVNAIGNVVLASTGDRTWGEAGMSILGAALSVVGLGGAARLVGGAASAARINARAAVQAGSKGERLTVMEAARLRPADLARSERMWAAPINDLPPGSSVYRLHGGGAGPGGASFSSAHPSTLANPRQLLGLPDVNTADNLLIARVTDPDAVVLQRHALPLDGNPGGAPEYIIPGGGADGARSGIEVLSDTTFRIP